jgi:phosphoglucomutase
MSKNRCLRLLKFYLDEGEITEQTYKNARKWLTRPEYAEFSDDVRNLIQPIGLKDAFYTDIPFGTGGRRGLTGAGTNRINARTIGESAQGLAAQILKTDPDGSYAKRGVAIGYDVRVTSEQFATLTAEVLAGNGIRVYLFDAPRPTPVLSFAIRHLNCIAGAIITASHNPPSDNGFKAYWEDGGQLVPPLDKQVLNQVKKVRSIRRMDLAMAIRKKLVTRIGKKVDNAYFRKLKLLTLSPKRNAVIVFSPLHGTGAATIPQALEQFGFKKVHMPPAQLPMDGNFPTVADNYPNPELPAAMAQAVKLAEQVKADVAMASDPDADRLGVFVPDAKGQYVYLSGNQVGAMLAHFICEMRKKNKSMPKSPFMLTTLVSTRMARAVADRYQVKIEDDLLVGFKWMAELLKDEEAAGRNLDDFLFGFEESIGFLRGKFVRDKDAAAGAVTLAELTAWCKARKISLLEYLDELYALYGYFREKQVSKFLRGAAGSEMMEKLMRTLRTSPPKKIGQWKVHAVVDRLSGTRFDSKTRQTTQVSGTKGNVLVFELDSQGKTSITIRPSGTEPKIKHYFTAFGETGKNLGATKKKVDGLIEKIAGATEAMEEQLLKKLG